jgi:ATP-dependent exoDNAse (exonuclease V) beta subunit
MKLFPPAFISPSTEPFYTDKKNGGRSSGAGKANSYGRRLTITGRPDLDRMGDCLHRYLCAHENLVVSEREEICKNLINDYELSSHLDASEIVNQAEAFYGYIRKEYGDAAIHREMPLIYRHGKQTVNGIVDMVLETKEGLVIVDHKSFPGGSAKYEEKALGYADQLAWYREGMELTGAKVIGSYVHFFTGGAIVGVG